MQNRGAPDAACGRPSTGAASTTSTSGCGDQPGRPGLRKIASSFDKVRRAFTFRSDNGGTSSSSSSSRPGSPYPLSGGGAAADVDEPVKGSRVGEQQGESEHAGAVELTQANPRFSYDSDHAPPARR
ncbi:hypothetical protein MCOR14_006456 [Pyricularia oryzae]|nr:hypothetical protein MCOR34_010994 [Pyricularia oryzae]KAI6633920.1 hypothetical protein MCOR14_006456 [Pyricularia oryzae]